MRKLFLTIALLVNFCHPNLVTAQAPDWLWAKMSGGGGSNYSHNVHGIATDADGNVIITGSYSNPTITFGTTTLTNAGFWDIFIVKFNASGNVLWAKSVGGSASDDGYGVSTDANGNVFVSGSFWSPAITFGAVSLTNTTSSIEVFVVKYDSSGNALWANSAVGAGNDFSIGVTADGNGDLYMTGYFDSPVITFGTTTLNCAGLNDIFIVKYDASGNVLWAKSEGGAGNDEGRSLSTDAGGNVFLTGFFESLSITFGTTALVNAGSYDFYIVKYDLNGNVLWAKSGGGLTDDFSFSVATDTSGNAIITGYFSSPSITVGTDTLIMAGWSDLFIVKYDSSGNVLWAKSEGGINFEGGTGIATDKAGNLFLTGSFYSPSISFGSNTIINTYSGWSDIYLVKFDPGGNVLWVKNAGGTYDDYGGGVATNPDGYVFIAGEFRSSAITFGATAFVLPSNSGGVVYIAKVDTVISTGIAEVSGNSAIVIAPNPFSSQTTISFKVEQKNTTIKILDVLGKEINNLNFSGRQFSLEKGEMQSGIYFVQVIDENDNVTGKKIVIQ